METIESIRTKMEWEKDLYELNINWFDCIIVRYLWHLNWYVHVPFQLTCDIDIYELDVHWWITFDWNVERLWIQWLTKEYPESLIWFDTSHACDWFIYPDVDEETRACFIRWEYRNYEYVKSELEKLTLQLIK